MAQIKTKLYVKGTAPASGDTPTDYDIVVGCENFNMDSSRSEDDVTTLQDGFEASYEAGVRSHQVTGTIVYKATDAGKDAILAAFKTDSSDIWFGSTVGGTSAPIRYGKGIVTAFGEAQSKDGQKRHSFTIRVSGGITDGTTPSS